MPNRIAAAVLAASSLVLVACATDSQQQQQPRQATDTRNPCLGVAPAVGTSLVRREDCGVRPQTSVAAPAAQPASAATR